MGVVIHKRVINNYFISPEVFTSFLGNGIKVDSETIPASVAVNAGNGLGFNEDKQLEVLLGDGLMFDEDNRITVISQDSCIDNVVSSVQTLTRMLDASIALDGRQLVLTKTYSDIIVGKNEEGTVVSIDEGEPYSNSECVTFTDYCYCPPGYSARASTDDNPNFYTK